MQDGRDDNRGRLCDSRLDREQGNRPYRGGRKKAKDPLEARKARKEVLADRGSRWRGFPAVHHLTRKESEMKTAIIAFTVSFIVSTVIYRSNRRKKNGGR